MKEMSPYMHDVVRWRSSQLVQTLTWEEQGIYRHLMDEIWHNFSIPSDPDLVRRMCKIEDLERWDRIWNAICRGFVIHPSDPSKLVQSVLQEDRKRLQAIRNRRRTAGSLGGQKKAENRQLQLIETEDVGSTCYNPASENVQKGLAKPSQTQTPIEGSLLKDSPNFKDIDVLKNPQPPAEKRGGQPNPFYELFFDAYAANNSGKKYPKKDGDFVRQTALFKRLLNRIEEMPADGAQAVANYFASADNPQKTFADLCVRFDIFVKMKLDRFGKEVTAGGNHAGRNQSPAAERANRNAAAKARVLAGLSGTNGADPANGSNGTRTGVIPARSRRS